MATSQVKTVRKTAPTARGNPATKTAGKPKATPAVRKLAATKAANKKGTATSAPTGEEIQIKASKTSKKVAFRVAKGLSEAI